MNCSKCGRENEDRLIYCIYCGNSLGYYRKFKTSPENIIKAILTFLEVTGVEARLVEGSESLAGRIFSIKSQVRYGLIEVKGKNFNFICITQFQSHLPAIHLSFIVDVNALKFRNELNSKLIIKRAGLFRDHASDIFWKGRSLADKLNNEHVMRKKILQYVKNKNIGELKNFLKVELMGNGQVKITTVGITPTLDIFEAIDKIALHIHNLLE